MRVKEEWKQPVSRVDAWKAILLTVVLIAGILALGQVIFQTRFERLGWAVSLLALWMPMAEAIFKQGWRVLRTSQTLCWVGYTFFAGGNILPHGTAASWMTNIGALLMIGALGVTIFDFNRTRKSVSADTADATE